MWTAGTTAAGMPCMRLPLAAVGSVCRTSCPLSAVRTAIVRLMMVALISNCSMKLLFSSLKIKSAVYIDRTFVTIVFFHPQREVPPFTAAPL